MAKATIKTIAEEAGVSIATVSKALNDMPDVSDSVKARIREIAQRQGYITNSAARQLASGHAYAVGVILPDIARNETAMTYKYLAQRLQKSGYALYLADSGGEMKTEAGLVLELLEKGVGALVIMPAISDMRHIEDAVKGRVPVAYIGGAVNPNAANTVASDDYKGGMMAARVLFHGGCRSSAVFTWGPAATAQHERTRGFIAYMQEHGATVKTYNTSAVLGEDAGRTMAEKALAEGLPTGVFATDDLLAMGAMAVFAERGVSVPGKVQVVGYGNTPSAGLGLIGLTSVASPAHEIGICVADIVLGLIRGDGDIVTKLTLEPQLVRRATTMRAHGSAGRRG